MLGVMLSSHSLGSIYGTLNRMGPEKLLTLLATISAVWTVSNVWLPDPG